MLVCIRWKATGKAQTPQAEERQGPVLLRCRRQGAPCSSDRIPRLPQLPLSPPRVGRRDAAGNAALRPWAATTAAAPPRPFPPRLEWRRSAPMSEGCPCLTRCSSNGLRAGRAPRRRVRCFSSAVKGDAARAGGPSELCARRAGDHAMALAGAGAAAAEAGAARAAGAAPRAGARPLPAPPPPVPLPAAFRRPRPSRRRAAAARRGLLALGFAAGRRRRGGARWVRDALQRRVPPAAAGPAARRRPRYVRLRLRQLHAARLPQRRARPPALLRPRARPRRPVSGAWGGGPGSGSGRSGVGAALGRSPSVPPPPLRSGVSAFLEPPRGAQPLPVRPMPTPAEVCPAAQPGPRGTTWGRLLSSWSASPDFPIASAPWRSAGRRAWRSALVLQFESEHQRCLRELLADADRCTGYPSGELPTYFSFIPTFVSGQNTHRPTGNR